MGREVRGRRGKGRKEETKNDGAVRWDIKWRQATECNIWCDVKWS
jgi:hypothetical protein